MRNPGAGRCVLGLLVCVWFALGLAADGLAAGHALFDFSVEQPEAGWRVNQWGKNAAGEEGHAEIAAVAGPDGRRALRFTMRDAGGCSFISPDIPDGAWRDGTYVAVEAYYMGDGSASRMSLHLSGLAADGKTAARVSHALDSYAETWTRVVLTGGWHEPKAPTLDLSKLKSIYLSASGTQALSVAGIRLLTAADLQAIEAAKAPAQRAWEASLKPNLRRLPGFAYVEDDPGLPRVLIIGDSISIHYTHFVRQYLRGKANVHRIPTNGGPTDRGLTSLDSWIGEGKWDVIVFNWGLHDSKYEGWDRQTGKRYSTPETYASNLEALVVRLKATGAQLLWASTTPVPEGAKTHDVGDSVRFNTVATPIMAKHAIAVCDLYSLAKPDLAALQRPMNIHFNTHGSAVLARKVADAVLKLLSP